MVVNQIRLSLLMWLLLGLGGRTCLGQWPQFGGPTKNFLTESSEESSRYPAGEWSLELGMGDAAPVIAGNRIFVNESAFTDNGQEAMRFRCLNPLNGATLWQTLANESSSPEQDVSQAFPVRPMASPVAISDRLIAVSFGGWVTCVSQGSGEIVWQHDLVSEFAATRLQYGWSSSPWSDGKVVVVACGGPQAMVVAFDLDSGNLAWKSAPGEAAYGSFTELLFAGEGRHLCYMGRDEIVGIDPTTGDLLWSFPLTNPGLTNTVTPIALPNGELLVAGQGCDSCRRLRVVKVEDRWNVEEVWRSRHFPFYCNWLLVPSTNQYVAFGSKVLGGVDLENGKLQWRERGWTDANFCFTNDTLVGIRGDGVLAVAKPTVDSLELQAGARVVKDRVWAPPVVVGETVLIRGRNTLTSVDLRGLPKIGEMPAGTEIDSMTAMYGQPNEQVARLLKLAQQDPGTLSFDDYLGVAQDRSNRFEDSEYQSLLNALKDKDVDDLSLRIAKNWVERFPDSIVGFERMIELLRANDPAVADTLANARMVQVEFDIVVPDSTPKDAAIFLAGNTASLGQWKPDGLLLSRAEDGHYRASQKVPRGIVEFKLTRGSWDSSEVGIDGRNISNRRQRVSQPMVIRAQVQAWKS
mgnify:CR=1 FL=1